MGQSHQSGNTQYKFDAVGNLTNIIYSNALTAAISYFYDPDNRLTNMADAIGSHTFAYTSASQLESEAGPWANDTVAFLYSQGHRTNLSLSQPSGMAWMQGYAYDNEWRMTGITSPAGSFAYGYPASPSALIQSLALPNAAGISYQYDALARLTNSSLANYWGHVLDGYGYAYDALGLRTNLSRYLGITTNSISAGYDNIGQLISWSAKESAGTARLNEQLGYGFDAAGNLQNRTNDALAQSFAVDALNQLSTVSRNATFTETGATPAPATNITVNGSAAQTYGDFTFARTNITLANGNNGFTNIAQNVYGVTVTNTFTLNLPSSVSFLYDGNGNLTNDGTRSFVYDAENQLTNVNTPGAWKTEYVYDGLRRKRITRDYTWQGGGWLKTNETRFLYDAMLVIQERDTNNNPLVTYTRGLDSSGSRQGAGGIGGFLARSDVNGSAFYHSDGNGNVTALIDDNQIIVARYEYDGFGRLIGKWGTLADANVYRFSSKEFQRSSGLYAYGFRFYEPNFQRWLDRDPIGEPGGINLYEPMRNGPINLVDRYGLSIGNYFGFTSAPSEANQAMQALVQAHGYANMQEYAEENPGYKGWDPSDETAPVANTAAAATDLYVNGMQAVVPAGIVGKGTEAAAQGIADAAEEGWLSKLWNKCFNHKHHSIPKFVGGNAKQVLADLSPAIHKELHDLIRQNLADAGFPFDAANTSAQTWANYFAQNPGSQDAALNAVLDASRAIDAQYGTQVTQSVWQNVMQGNYTSIP